MGVDHGEGSGETSPTEFGVGDANANYPLRLLSYGYKKERSVAFKIHLNRFLPRTPLTTLPQTA